MKVRSKKTSRKKDPNDYPRMSFRPREDSVARMAALEKATGMNPSQIVNACLSNYLPVMMQRHEVKA